MTAVDLPPLQRAIDADPTDLLPVMLLADALWESPDGQAAGDIIRELAMAGTRPHQFFASARDYRWPDGRVGRRIEFAWYPSERPIRGLSPPTHAVLPEAIYDLLAAGYVRSCYDSASEAWMAIAQLVMP